MAEGHGLALHEELETSERSAETIRRDIAARRDSISGTVDRLGDRLHETFDWRMEKTLARNRPIYKVRRERLRTEVIGS